MRVPPYTAAHAKPVSGHAAHLEACVGPWMRQVLVADCVELQGHLVKVWRLLLSVAAAATLHVEHLGTPIAPVRVVLSRGTRAVIQHGTLNHVPY